jgi:CDGSH-type Zn-finger protein
MASKPAVPTKLSPVMVDLAKGQVIHWCRCGRSKNPEGMCDGSHARENTGLTPLAHTAEADGKRAICMCKATKNPPFCDGSHVKLAEAARGKAAAAPGPRTADIEDLARRPAVPPGSTADEPTMGCVSSGIGEEGRNGRRSACFFFLSEVFLLQKFHVRFQCV